MLYQVYVRSFADSNGDGVGDLRDVLALRRATADLHAGPYTSLAAPDGVWRYRRGARHVVALNFSDAPVELDRLRGRVVLATDRSLDGTVIDSTLSLPAWQAAIVHTDA